MPRPRRLNGPRADAAFVPHKFEWCGRRITTRSCVACKGDADAPEVTATCAAERAPRLAFWHLARQSASCIAFFSKRHFLFVYT